MEAHDPASASTAPDAWEELPPFADPSDFIAELYDPDQVDLSDPSALAIPLAEAPLPPLPPPAVDPPLPPFPMRPLARSLFPDRPWQCLLAECPMGDGEACFASPGALKTHYMGMGSHKPVERIPPAAYETQSICCCPHYPTLFVMKAGANISGVCVYLNNHVKKFHPQL
jgi:hypothetical protein